MVLAGVGMLTLTGCSVSDEDYVVESRQYSDETTAVMERDIEITLCAVAGKTKVNQEDVDSFYLLSSNLKTYEGENREQALKVADDLELIALGWDMAEDKTLDENSIEKLNTLCEKAKQG